jgi:CRISPR-associated protein Cas1
MEEFRSFADRLALTLVNRLQLRAGDFASREGGAVGLAGDARKAVVVAYQERKQEELAHALLEQPVALGLLPMIQARLMARAIRGETDGYLPFVMR